MALTPARLLADDGAAVHVGHEDVGNSDGAVGLLVVFQNCEIGAANREAAAVESVKKLGLLGACRTVTDVGAARLEGFEVRAGGDLAVEILSGQPDLEVVCLGGGEAHVASAE